MYASVYTATDKLKVFAFSLTISPLDTSSNTARRIAMSLRSPSLRERKSVKSTIKPEVCEVDY